MRRLFLFVLFAGIWSFATCAHGADLTGTWEGEFDYQGRSVPLTFHFTATSGTLTGSIEGLPTSPTEIRDGKIEAGKVSFWSNTDYQGQTYKLLFTGHISIAADKIAFALGTEDGSWSSALVARKAASPPAAQEEPDVTGTWKGSFDFQGTPAPVTLDLKSSGRAVTGTVDGMIEGAPEKPIEIHDGQLDGDKLSFWLDTLYEAQTYRIVYSGTVADREIKFTFGTEDGSWSSDLTVKKQ